MPDKLPIVAQRVMDLYYQSYKSSSQFFDLDDFVFYTGSTIADIFQQEARVKYAELRALKEESVVCFPADWLLQQTLKVQRKNNEIYVDLELPVMGFSYDNQVIGIQDILPVKPKDATFERTTLAAAWQIKLAPYVNRTFWYAVKDRVIFQNKALCNIVEVNVLYVPAIGSDMLVPDGIIKMAVDQTVATMRQLGQSVVEKKGIDGQGQNKTIETEMNKLALK
jgi:hypothetical protein